MMRTFTVAAVLLAASAVASADEHGHHDLRDFSFRFHERSTVVAPVAAPEIDPASIVVGLTLLGGGLAVLRGRRSKTPKP